MTNLRALLSRNIKKRREKLGLSQAKLAERVERLMKSNK
jgi:predicted transcriptional regulator